MRQTIIEPFRIKSVEPIGRTTLAERDRVLEEAGYNLFEVPAERVLIDLLTDSGTSAMSADQWAGVTRGDESYAGARSFYRLKEVVQRIFGFEHVIPVHQGRAAERILFGLMAESGAIVPSNTHFDTTRANVEAQGATALDLPCPESADLFSEEPFKGNTDIEALEALLGGEDGGRVPLVMSTITNNSMGGHPVSLRNLRSTASVASKYGVPAFVDAARFAENAGLISQREKEEEGRTPPGDRV